MPSLRDYSVKFGRDPVMGLEGKNVFPFMYSLVNHNDIDWKPAPLTLVADIPVSPEVGQRFTAANTSGPYFSGCIYQWSGSSWFQSGPDLSTYCILCKANSVTPHYVRLDPDYNYKLIALKYTAYSLHQDSNPLQMSVLQNAVTDAGIVAPPRPPMETMLYLEHSMPGTRYTSFISVTLSVQGSGSQTLFGGQNVQAINGGAARIPLAVDCMQGYEYGFQALRCEYIAPLQGVLSFEFTNSLPVPEEGPENDLYVSAAIYGFKIRL